MRQKRTEKVYAKVFHITNKDGTFTEEDFNLLKEKFEIIRKLYAEKRDIFPIDDQGFPPIVKYISHDCYNSFRTIIKEIKRAAHNANLNAELLKVDYKTGPYSINLSRTKEEKFGHFNLVVTFKSAVNYSEPDQFVITQIMGLEVNKEIGYLGEFIYIDRFMRNDNSITYLFWKRGEEKCII